MSKADSKADTQPKQGASGGTALGDAYDKVSERVTAAYAAARDKAGGALETAGTGLETNPVAALLGGLALGAIAGALLPRLEQEKNALAPVGEKIADAARAAFDAAKSAGGEALGEAGLTPDAIRGQVPKILEQVMKAAGAAGTAAVSAARDASGR